MLLKPPCPDSQQSWPTLSFADTVRSQRRAELAERSRAGGEGCVLAGEIVISLDRQDESGSTVPPAAQGQHAPHLGMKHSLCLSTRILLHQVHPLRSKISYMVGWVVEGA